MDSTTLSERFPDGLSGRRMHAVGAGGHGISAGLLIAQAHGIYVTGCDVAETSTTRYLTDQGIAIVRGHDVHHVAGADLVVTNPAVTALDEQHPELVAARERGIPVVQWQELLGYLMRDQQAVSVAGVHGKGSTAALLGALAIAGGLDPTVEVGAFVKDWGSNIRIGASEYIINEADEWNYNFKHYHPRMVLLTAIEFDHPEFFTSYEAIRDAFVQFLRGMNLDQRLDGALPPTIVLNADSPGCLDALAQLQSDGAWPGVVRTFGLERDDVDVSATDLRVDSETSFTLVMQGQALGRVTLATPGRHSIANAVAAAAGADALGVARDVLVPTLSTFAGLRRRFEVIEDGDVTFIDDYAHHPHAVALTIETVRQRYPGRRLVAVFQPTLYTRLQRFLPQFAAAFDAADEVVIVEIQPSRERDTGLIHGSELVRAIAARPIFARRAGAVRYGGTIEETGLLLRALRQPGDLVVVMGSGPVNRAIAGARLASVGE